MISEIIVFSLEVTLNSTEFRTVFLGEYRAIVKETAPYKTNSPYNFSFIGGSNSLYNFSFRGPKFYLGVFYC